ncbi:MAG: hypothetical protein ABI634_11865 [Acidobacteriota bacterium]
MSPIYVRPAREQSEHDRLIRHLQTKYKKKFEVAVNIDGVEPATFVKIGPATLSPDLVLTEGKKLVGLVEVETGESVNNLEAMAQWVHLSHARVPFHLYVPVHGYEPARRLCDAYQVRVGEIWTYRPTHDGFDLVRMHQDPGAASGVRGVKALPVSIFIPAPPKPVVPEVVEPPRPVPAAKPVVPAKPVMAPAKTAVKPAAKPEPKPVAKPVPIAPAKAVKPATPAPAAPKSVVKPAAKPAPRPAPKPAAKPALKLKKDAKVAKAPSKPVKAAKAAKPAKASTPVKGKPAQKGAAKAKHSTPARGKKAAPRKSR